MSLLNDDFYQPREAFRSIEEARKHLEKSPLTRTNQQSSEEPHIEPPTTKRTAVTPKRSLQKRTTTIK